MQENERFPRIFKSFKGKLTSKGLTYDANV